MVDLVQLLESFVNFTLDITEEEHGGLVQDKAHNAITYKAHDAYVRFYTTTKTLKLHGPNSDLLKHNFLKLLNQEDSGNVGVTSDGVNDGVNESSSTSTVGDTVGKRLLF